jgi:hypothetical protein
MTSDPGRQYLLGRAIYVLTQKALAASNMVTTTAPIAELTAMQNITLRVAFGGVIRDAIAVGRWYERAKAGSDEPPPKTLARLARAGNDRQASATTGKPATAGPAAVAGENPRFDEDATTEPIETVARLLRRLTQPRR